MIDVTVNGARHNLQGPVNIRGLLERLEMAGKKVAVECNGDIVPRGLHEHTFLRDGDRLEIVVAVGGG